MTEGLKGSPLKVTLPGDPPYLIGALRGTRTPDPLLRRQMLYPAELSAQKNGAGDGNRTHVTSLEGWNSTIELHPHIRDGDYITTITAGCQ